VRTIQRIERGQKPSLETLKSLAAVFELDGDWVFASYLVRIELDTKMAHSHFFNYVFNSPIVRNQINAISRQIIGQANINTEEVGDLKIPLPPLKTQKAIVVKIEKSMTSNSAKFSCST